MFLCRVAEQLKLFLKNLNFPKSNIFLWFFLLKILLPIHLNMTSEQLK